MRIKTKRLLITEFNTEMIESVYLNSHDEDNRRFVPDEVFESIEEAQGVVEFLIQQYNSDEGPFVYPILLHTNDNIGYIQIIKLEGGWEIGYHIAKKYTRQGYATEAVEAFLPIIMKSLDIKNVYGICVADNVASCKVLEKAGFILEYRGVSDYQNTRKLIHKYKYSI